MRASVDVHVTTEDIISGGHKPGVIRIADLTLFFNDMLWDGNTSPMEALRDECQSQIDQIKAQRAAPVSAPVDHKPYAPDHCDYVSQDHGPCLEPWGHEGEHIWSGGYGTNPIPLTPEETVQAASYVDPVPVSAPLSEIAAPYMTPQEVLPQGQPVETVIVLDESDVPF